MFLLIIIFDILSKNNTCHSRHRVHNGDFFTDGCSSSRSVSPSQCESSDNNTCSKSKRAQTLLTLWMGNWAHTPTMRLRPRYFEWVDECTERKPRFSSASAARSYFVIPGHPCCAALVAVDVKVNDDAIQYQGQNEAPNPSPNSYTKFQVSSFVAFQPTVTPLFLPFHVLHEPTPTTTINLSSAAATATTAKKDPQTRT